MIFQFIWNLIHFGPFYVDDLDCIQWEPTNWVDFSCIIRARIIFNSDQSCDFFRTLTKFRFIFLRKNVFVHNFACIFFLITEIWNAMKCARLNGVLLYFHKFEKNLQFMKLNQEKKEERIFLLEMSFQFWNVCACACASSHHRKVVIRWY